MKLYYSPGACSLSPHIVAREAGIPVQLQKVNTKDKSMEGGGDFWKVNPRGYVPVLELDNGERLTEGPAIVQYLADQKPETGLAPKSGTFERYRLQEWLNFLTSEVHKQFSVADAYAFVLLGWTKPTQIDLSKWPNLQALHKRVGARPKVKEAMQAEGLIPKEQERAA